MLLLGARDVKKEGRNNCTPPIGKSRHKLLVRVLPKNISEISGIIKSDTVNDFEGI